MDTDALAKARDVLLTRGQKYFFYGILIITALATTILTVLMKRLDLKSNWSAAIFVFFEYAVSVVLLRFGQAMGLGFLTAVAVNMTCLTGVLGFGQLIFFLWGPTREDVLFDVFTLLCCAANLLLTIMTARLYWQSKRTNAQLLPQHFAAGFAAAFLLAWILGRKLVTN